MSRNGNYGKTSLRVYSCQHIHMHNKANVPFMLRERMLASKKTENLWWWCEREMLGKLGLCVCLIRLSVFHSAKHEQGGSKFR
jgi:hypothetical protein